MSHIPPYVFVLMVALLYVGISRCFSRTMRVERLLVLPALMTIFGVRGFLGLFPQPVYGDLIAALAGGAIGIALGWHHARGWRIRVDRRQRLIRVPGDVMMLVIILGIFGFEYALHDGAESRAHWFKASEVEPIAAATWSWFAAMSAGRNLNLVMRYLEATPVAQAASPAKP